MYQEFMFEMTDTYGTELNYCWLKKYVIKARSLKGALIKLSIHTGLNFRNNGIYYKAKQACIGAYEFECDLDDIVTEWKESAEYI